VERYICIHGHFYQPPRENPWLEAVELQDSAYPYHDWNKRITDECYAPNMGARILDNEGRIARIINTYGRISFDFSPVLLSWLEQEEPTVYEHIITADRESRARFSGHGSAMATIYNHMIMPLANRRDRETQIVWGIRDFEHRFGHHPDGMWLSETAVDLETLDMLAEHGIRFTVLSPRQVWRVRPLGGESDWQGIGNGHIDPTMPYIQRLPSGRTIEIFFYDEPISRAVAFEGVLSNGEKFARRLMDGFDASRDHPQLVHIATDGESYGHYAKHGEMALAYVLHQVETGEQARLTNYGEFLDLCPPTHEVEILERTAWSCSHGVGRWHRDCGCNTGRNPSWSQAWREPLRSAFDWLRDRLATPFEEYADRFLYDAWAARNDYINVILDRSPENIAIFEASHTTRALDHEELVGLLRLLEMQRYLLLMYTSSGWYFDDVSNLETVQVIRYAGRAIHLARLLFPDAGQAIEDEFLALLEQATSNIPEHRDGRYLYEKWVQPSAIDLPNLGAHYAISSLFERYGDQATIYCYQVEQVDYHRFDPGIAHVAIGQIRVTSTITRNSELLCFGVLHFGEHNVNAGVCPAPTSTGDKAAYRILVQDVAEAANRGDIAEVVRLLDRYFGGLEYSSQSLFRDAQRSFLELMLESTLADDDTVYRQVYERRMPLMHLLNSLGVPLPRVLHATAEFVINSDLRRAVSETLPNREAIDSILEQARTWGVELDTVSLAYTFQQTMERLSEQTRTRPDDLSQLQSLEMLVDIIQAMPFTIDFWTIQNTYYEMINTVYVEMQERADEGEEAAQEWTTSFISLGDRLGIRVTEMSDMSVTPTVASLTEDVLADMRIPRATYRFQFSPSFSFSDALALVDYLDDLGVSDCYASPLFRARAGSSHGYDVCDHSQINPVLGGEEGLNALSAALRERGMNIVLDIVPNHMGIGDVCNTWWMDVLENGPSSDYASYFDIEWNPVKPELANKVLLPILGDQYGRVLENGELRLVYEEESFFIQYYEHRFPVAPGTYSHILGYKLDELTPALEAQPEYLQEYQSILTAISYLPPRTEIAPEKRIERNREKEVIKRRIATLYNDCETVRTAIAEAVQAFNGNIGDPHSFDLLDDLINAQSYRLAYWRVAAEEINYRRFFDINDLAAIRTEDPDVFHDTHQLIFRLLTENKILGLRIDHIDGLFDPEAYFRQLQEGYVFHRVKDHLAQVRKEMPDDDTLKKRVVGRIAAWEAEHHESGYTGALSWPMYVVAEKILSEDESLPHNWAVHGTTGYDFLAAANNLFVNSNNGDKFDMLYQRFTGYTRPFHELVNANKKMIMLVSMDSEIYALSHQLERTAERNRRYRDFTLNTLTFAIREVIACLSVYRTYTTDSLIVLHRDRQFIEAAVAEARRRNPRTAAAVFDFIREMLLLDKLEDFRPEDQQNLVQWVRKFQQVTGPVMAKGVEDTSFYVYNRLVSLNEVGGHPEHFGSTVESFHQRNSDNQRSWPHTLLSSSTHDTKRSEDVRARINVLSEMPQQWEDVIAHWTKLNEDKKQPVDNSFAPSRNDEYLLYQSLIGAWPLSTPGQHPPTGEFPIPLLTPADGEAWGDFRGRIAAYMQKATKEAKVHTSWVQPNQPYDAAVQDFVHNILSDNPDDPFLTDMHRFTQMIAFYGQINSLTQVLLKLTVPGVPDIYQGTELWDLSLVDPDNRRPVDYERRRGLLAHLKERVAQAPNGNQTALVRELLDTGYDGRVKLYLIYRLLQFRRAHPRLFASSSYLPLEVAGEQAAHGFGFARTVETVENGPGEPGERMVIVAPRLVATLCDGKAIHPIGPEVWGESWLLLPEDDAGRSYRHHLTGEVIAVSSYQGEAALPLAEVFASFPVAMLERVQ
jgi:(1->4)-alpha-D-glucan 1-alpha-D-glucosylmutase